VNTNQLLAFINDTEFINQLSDYQLATTQLIMFMEDKGKTIPLQSWTSSEGSRRWRLPDFMTIGTLRWKGCNNYAPAVFTPPPPPQEMFLVRIFVRG
jgi:hypothetical protein